MPGRKRRLSALSQGQHPVSGARLQGEGAHFVQADPLIAAAQPQASTGEWRRIRGKQPAEQPHPGLSCSDPIAEWWFDEFGANVAGEDEAGHDGADAWFEEGGFEEWDQESDFD